MSPSRDGGERGAKRPYPAAMYRWPNPPMEVAPEQFVSQQDAARELGAAVFTVGRLIAEGRLRAATCEGIAGVTRASLQEELAQREKRFWRVRAFLRSLLHWV